LSTIGGSEVEDSGSSTVRGSGVETGPSTVVVLSESSSLTNLDSTFWRVNWVVLTSMWCRLDSVELSGSGMFRVKSGSKCRLSMLNRVY
jgi:hypothetical protein